MCDSDLNDANCGSVCDHDHCHDEMERQRSRGIK